jgi:hypothetical protein
MTRSTNFTAATFDALALFGDPTPTVPRGLTLARPARRWSLRPTWIAVAVAGIVGTFGGVLIAVLSGPVVG